MWAGRITGKDRSGESVKSSKPQQQYQLIMLNTSHTDRTSSWKRTIAEIVETTVKPEFHYADFPETSPWGFGEVNDSSQGSRQHGSCYGKVAGSFGVSSHRNMSRWFEKSGDKLAKIPSASGKWENQRHPQQDTGKSVTSRPNQQGRHAFVADLLRTSRESPHSGIWALDNKTWCKQSRHQMIKCSSSRMKSKNIL